MKCTQCGEETRVADSRLLQRSNRTWRRRECFSCKQRFTTVELATADQGQVDELQREILDIRARLTWIFEALEHVRVTKGDAK